MEVVIAIVIGALFAGGIYCLLRRSLMKLIVGLILLSQGANLLVFASGGLTRAAPVFADPKTGVPPAPHADPLPQALVLTAIVISFGLVVFTISLLLRAHQTLESDDIDTFRKTDRIE